MSYSTDVEPAGREIAHYHNEGEVIRNEIMQATREALGELQQIIVTAEHTVGDICSYFGIHDFSHNLAIKNLTGATLTLYTNGTLEIKREGVKHATQFPVQLVA